MAPLHKMSLDFYEAEFTLIALYTSIEDYALAYWLNTHLKTKFKRQRKDLDFGEDAQYAVFTWLDVKTDSYWSLISNKQLRVDEYQSEDLFKETPLEKKKPLIPEQAQVDFFIKIEDEGYTNTSKLLEQLKQIPLIVTAFSVEYNQLKSKNNLIF